MTEVAAPAPTGATTAPAEGTAAPQPAPDPGEPQNAIQAIFAKRQAKEAAAAKAAEGGPDKPADTPAPGDKPEPAKEGDKPPAEEKGLSLKHAQLKADHRKTLADHEKLKADHAATAKELEGVKAKFTRNPFKALEEVTGKSFKELVERASKGEFDERSALPPEQQAKLDAFERWQKEQEAEKEQSKAKAARAEDVSTAEQFMKAHADKYPLFALSGFAGDEIVNRAYADLKANREPDFEAIAQACEEEASKNLEGLFTNTDLLSVLAKRPHLRQSWLQALGLSEHTAPRPASGTSGESGTGNGPRTLSHTTTQESPVPPPSGDEPEVDWLAGAKARLNQYKQHGRIGR